MKNLLILVIGILFVYLIASILSAPKNKLDWSETYYLENTKPYDMSILGDIIKINPNTSIYDVSNESLTEWDIEDLKTEYQTFLFVNWRLYFESNIVPELIDLVESGKIVFLSAYFLDEKLLSELNIKVEENKFLKTDTSYTNFLKDSESKIKYNLITNRGINQQNYFESLASDINILGYNNDKKPNFIRKKMGEGELYLHLNPKNFTNINLVNTKSLEYTNDLIELIDPRFVYMDNFYKGNYRFRDDDISAFNYIWNNPRLNLAYWVALILIILFLLLNTQRVQNIMKLHSTPINMTKEFVSTIAQLYYSRKDNKSIAKTEIAYFISHIKSQYHYTKIKIDKKLAIELAYQSGCDKKLIIDLFNTMIRINRSKIIQDSELVQLTKLITEYHSKRQ